MITNSDAQGLYYRPSGRFSFSGLVVMLAFGGVAGVVLGAAYGYLDQFNPIVYINFLATLLFGAGMALAARFGVRNGKVRSPLLAALVGIIIGVIGMYSAWVFWINALSVRSKQAVWAFDPGRLWSIMQAIAQHGAWSLKGTNVSGAALWIIWAIEAAIVIGICTVKCRSYAREPYCEECGAWAEPAFGGLRAGRCDDARSLRMQLEAGNLGALSALPSPTTDRFSEIKLTMCPECQKVGYLSVAAVTIVAGRKGKAEKKSKTLVEHLRLGPAPLAQAQQMAGADGGSATADIQA